MTSIISLLDTISNSDALFFLILIILIIMIIAMFYLLYKENNHNLTIKLENTKANDETKELKNITKELEQLPRERTIKLTPYEEEQEEKAIISYEELLSKNDQVSIGYKDENLNDDILIKEVDLDNTGKIELDPIKKELNSKVNVLNYEHEEAFLKALKQLQNLLN